MSKATIAASECFTKIVVFDEEDYTSARQVAERCRELPVYLQPGNHTPP
jgi:7-carboxy-7-deazaguanine synthase